MFLSVKEIVDKILIESDIQSNEYSVDARLLDVNQTFLDYIELANQIGSSEPISNAEVVSETFTTVDGFNEFIRTINDVAVFRVDFRVSTDSKWCRLTEDLTRRKDNYSCYCGCDCNIMFYADEKRIFIENGRAGSIRVTYVRGNIQLITRANYDSVTPVYPTWIPSVFRDILWLEPALHQAKLYKPSRVEALESKLARKIQLFRNHYIRNAKYTGRLVSDDSIGNYR